MTKATKDTDNIFQTGRNANKRRRTPEESQTLTSPVKSSSDINHGLFIPPPNVDDFVIPGLPPVEKRQATKDSELGPAMPIAIEDQPLALFLSKLREGCFSNHLFAEAFMVDTTNLPELRSHADFFSFSTQTIITELEEGGISRRAWLIIGINSEIVNDVAKYVEREWKRKIKRSRNAHRILTVNQVNQFDEDSSASTPAKSTMLSWCTLFLVIVLAVGLAVFNVLCI